MKINNLLIPDIEYKKSKGKEKKKKNKTATSQHNEKFKPSK